MKGSVWPGLCHFPDFTRPDVREWWATLFKDLIGEVGVRGIWNDMNEPAVFEEGTFPHDVRHDYDGHPCSHRKAHNIYGMQMVRATRQGLKLWGKGRRAFSITRSAYAGTQRFACAWTGDNVASWEHLNMANTQCQRLATSGMSFIGSDIGGFIETPTPELYLRWVQLAVFHPFFRTHSSGDHGEQEPWSFGEDTTDWVKRAIEMRYRLLPAIYTAFWQYANEGTPMLRSLPLVDHQNPDAYWRSAEFFFGDHLYVVPIMAEGEEGRFLYLPRGDWFAYHDDSRPKAVATDIWIECPIDRIPVLSGVERSCRTGRCSSTWERWRIRSRSCGCGGRTAARRAAGMRTRAMASSGRTGSIGTRRSAWKGRRGGCRSRASGGDRGRRAMRRWR